MTGFQNCVDASPKEYRNIGIGSPSIAQLSEAEFFSKHIHCPAGLCDRKSADEATVLQLASRYSI